MSAIADNAMEPEELARKVLSYSHLLPPASPEMLAKMQSGTPQLASEAEGDTTATAVAAPVALPPANWPKLGPDQARDRALGCFLGLAAGDAVGATVAGKPRDSFPAVADMLGGGPHSLAPGEWTANTAMALCVAEALLEAGTIDQGKLLKRFRGWLERGENTVSGQCIDIGVTTRAAIERFAAGGFTAATSGNANAAGNGSLVRLAPLAIFSAGKFDQAQLLAIKQSRTTHGTQECLDASKLFVAQLLDALDGADKDGATRQRVLSLSPNTLFISAGEWRTKNRDEIKSSGYVVHTLEAALWSVWQTDNFRDAVLTAANLGDDANGVAAVAGQLAGALYGAAAIPGEWLAKVAWREKIEKLANDLFDRNAASR